MSYEGYDEWLCEAGHVDQADSTGYDSPFRQFGGDNIETWWRCPVMGCGKKLAWWQSVDTTNGLDLDTNDYGEVHLEIAELERTETCNLGHVHVVKPATFKIPTKGGHRVKP